MINELIIYDLNISKIKKLFLFFTKKEKIRYILVYRIDEDRFWFYKYDNDKLSDDHLMKQNLDRSLETMERIKDRFRDFNNFMTNKCSIEYYSMKDSNIDLYDKINEYSNSKEDYYNNKNTRKFLLDDI